VSTPHATSMGPVKSLRVPSDKTGTLECSGNGARVLPSSISLVLACWDSLTHPRAFGLIARCWGGSRPPNRHLAPRTHLLTPLKG
jgi:hypothetical protein